MITKKAPTIALREIVVVEATVGAVGYIIKPTDPTGSEIYERLHEMT